MKTSLISAIPAVGKWGGPVALLIVALASSSIVAQDDPPANGSVPASTSQEAEVTNTIGMKLVRIPAGEFLMGRGETPDSLFAGIESSAKLARFFAGERPQRTVRISRPFLMGVHEVTVGEFGQFVGDTNYQTDAEHQGRGSLVRRFGDDRWEVDPGCTWQAPGFAQTDKHPAVCLSWNDAVVFCEWLSRKEGETYRLPTEAEWEYACRAGTDTRFHHGDDAEQVVQVANISDATIKVQFPAWRCYIQQSDDHLYTAPVKSYEPNAWGLHDMHGNALEWCQDWYAPDYYLSFPPRDDPQGPESGTQRVVRGGAIFSGPLRADPPSGPGMHPAVR